MKQRTIHPLIVFFALLCAAAVAAQPVAPVQQAPSKEWAGAIQHVDRMTSEELARDGVGSVTIGLVSGPKLVWTKSYGYADMEAKRPATRESVYRIGSITKQFTALMLLQLVEQGKVHLADPVEKYVPEVLAVSSRPAPRPTAAPIAAPRPRDLWPALISSRVIRLRSITTGAALPFASRVRLSSLRDASVPRIGPSKEDAVIRTRLPRANLGASSATA